MATETNAVVIENRRVQSVYFRLELHCPPIAEQVVPGQFVMLRVTRDTSLLLKRPFSVYRSYSPRHSNVRRRGNLVIIYKKVGKGTEKMAELRDGEIVQLIGPLGNGFRLPPLPSSAKTILIGGGVGIVSLYSLAEASWSAEPCVFVGGRTKQDILCVRDFEKSGSHVFVATEDGSMGFKGNVIDLFRSEKGNLKEKGSYYLYSCGPLPMLKGLSGAVKSKRFICQISLEARMACGFGACYGCVVKTKDPQTPYHRVCEEGPVFDLDDILWE